MRNRDSQRSACYSWEQVVFPNSVCRLEGVLNRAEMQQLMDAACDRYGVNKLGIKRTGSRGGYYYWERRIGLPQRSRSPHLILHEVAHHVLYERCDTACAPHGPQFTTILLELCEAFIEAFDAKAAKQRGREQQPRKVKFAPKTRVPRPASRRGVAKVKRMIAAAYARAGITPYHIGTELYAERQRETSDERLARLQAWVAAA